MKAQHRLVGYDRKSQFGTFELPIPADLFQELVTLVRIDDDDPEAIGCYELTDYQAHRIATLLQRDSPLPTGLDFFLEADTGEEH